MFNKTLKQKIMERTKIKIGLFGFGCVGKGLYDVLHQTPGLKAEIVKICVKDRAKKRSIPDEFFTFDRSEVLNHPDINIIVELIDDSEAAFEIVSTALKSGKGVVSANKKMIAEHFDELLALQKLHNAPLLYEAASCASIPIIRNLEEYYDNDLLQNLSGIVNGSTNYILTKIFRDNLNFADSLKMAQELGFAESNPALDVEGFDAKFKLTILLAHAFGIVARPENLINLGIQKIGDLESRFAREKAYKIKLIARAQKVGNKIAAFVMPQFVSRENNFYHINDEYNAVQTECFFADKQLFTGKGAGSHPTASAVLSDLSALTYDYRYEYKKLQQNAGYELTRDFKVEVFVRFSDEVNVPAVDFDEISERYSSQKQNYVIGKIHFETLINSDWYKNPAVSVVLAENPIV
jgi:homoserine dehydrogenase